MYVGFNHVKTFSPPMRVGPGLEVSFDVQASLRLPVFDSTECTGLMLDVRADLKLLMTSGDPLLVGAAEVSP